MRLQLLARDVILATQPVQGLSVRNALAGTVVAIEDDEWGRAGALRRRRRGGAGAHHRRSAAALQLGAGDAVWVLVKAVSTRGHAFRIRACSLTMVSTS